MKRTNCKRCHWFCKIRGNDAPWGKFLGGTYKSCLFDSQNLTYSRPLRCENWIKKSK